jgi:ribosome biogenesis GTPase
MNFFLQSLVNIFLEENMDYTNLKKYGLTPCFEREAAPYEGLFLARVTEQHRDIYTVAGENGEMPASVSGKFAHNTAAARISPPWATG